MGSTNKISKRRKAYGILLLQEELKTLPWEEVYEEYLEETHCAGESLWFQKIKEYEKDVMSKRGE